MVTDSTRDRRRDGDRADDRPERGQVILIGAIALAFIVLGVVVVFNGVLYTETLSSADTGQSASEVDAAELEVRQGVACLVKPDDGVTLGSETEFGSLVSDDELDAEIETYADLYRNATTHSQPTAVDVEREPGSPAADLFGDGVDVTVSYDSADVSYERTISVTANDCPRSPSIEQFNVTPRNASENRYTVDWAVSSDHSDLSRVNVTLYENDTVLAENSTESFDRDDYHDDTDKPEPEDTDADATHIRIAVRNEAGYVATATNELN